MQIRSKSVRKSYWLVCIIALIFVLPFLTFPRSYASASIVQSQCFRNASVSNNQNISLTFGGAALSGHIVTVVVSVQGAANQAINYVNVSDGHLFYPERIRTTDFGNTLIVAIFSGKLNYSGVTTIYTQYKAATNVNNQVVFCAYELAGLTNALPAQTFHQEGGSASLVTGTTGDVVISGADYNGGGGQVVFSGTLDDGSGGFIGIGHGAGTYSGVTGVTFSEEADVSFTAPVTSVTVNTSVDTALISGSINEAVAFVEWLIPSLIILFLFTWLGLKAGAGTEVILILEIFAFAIIGVIGILFSPAGFWPPFWTAFLGIVFCIIGLAYSKGRTH